MTGISILNIMRIKSAFYLKLLFRLSIVCSISAFTCECVYGQISKLKSTPAKDTILINENRTKTDTFIRQKDIGDLYNIIFNRHVEFVPDSLKVRPGRLLFAALPGVGYSLQSGLTAVCNFNFSFYTANHSSTNLSTIVFSPEYSFTKHQITMPVVINIWTKGNKYNWVGDWRYLKFPSATYGLGSFSSLSNADVIDYSYIRFYQELLKQVKPDLLIGAGYALDYHWLINNTSMPASNVDYANYNKGNSNKTISSGIILEVLYDQRRNINNPEQGYYLDIAYRPNLKVLGSDQNWQSLLIDVRKYFRFPAHSNNILAFWSFNWLTPGGNPPYLDLPSTGWDTYANMGRGFIQGRFRGSNLLYLETEYRFGILRNGLIGGVVFANAETVSEYPGNNFQKILPAAGPGLRFKINKYSKINLCVDYGFGIDGTHGLFFNLGEVF